MCGDKRIRPPVCGPALFYSAHHTGHVYLKMSESEPRGGHVQITDIMLSGLVVSFCY